MESGGASNNDFPDVFTSEELEEIEFCIQNAERNDNNLLRQRPRYVFGRRNPVMMMMTHAIEHLESFTAEEPQTVPAVSRPRVLRASADFQLQRPSQTTPPPEAFAAEEEPQTVPGVSRPRVLQAPADFQVHRVPEAFADPSPSSPLLFTDPSPPTSPPPPSFADLFDSDFTPPSPISAEPPPPPPPSPADPSPPASPPQPSGEPSPPASPVDPEDPAAEASGGPATHPQSAIRVNIPETSFTDATSVRSGNRTSALSNRSSVQNGGQRASFRRGRRNRIYLRRENPQRHHHTLWINVMELLFEQNIDSDIVVKNNVGDVC